MLHVLPFSVVINRLYSLLRIYFLTENNCRVPGYCRKYFIDAFVARIMGRVAIQSYSHINFSWLGPDFTTKWPINNTIFRKWKIYGSHLRHQNILQTCWMSEVQFTIQIDPHTHCWKQIAQVWHVWAVLSLEICWGLWRLAAETFIFGVRHKKRKARRACKKKLW